MECQIIPVSSISSQISLLNLIMSQLFITFDIMSEYQLHQAGTIQKPRFLGRLLRFLSAALMIYLTVVVIDNYQRYLHGEVHDAMLWFLVFLALHLLPPVINISFGVNLKSRPQWWFILAFFISVYIGYLVEGAGWGLVSGSLRSSRHSS